MAKYGKKKVPEEEMKQYEDQIKHVEKYNLPKIDEEELEKAKGKQKDPVTGLRSKMTKEEQEARFALIQRMLFRKVPKKEIAKQLGITPRHLSREIRKLEEKTVKEVKKMDFPQFVGNTLSFYDEVRGMSLMMASDKHSNRKEKLQALGVALRAEQDKHQFFALCGVYKSPHALEQARKMITPESEVETQEVSEVLTSLAKTLLKTNPLDVKTLPAPGDTDYVEAEIINDTTEKQ